MTADRHGSSADAGGDSLHTSASSDVEKEPKRPRRNSDAGISLEKDFIPSMQSLEIALSTAATLGVTLQLQVARAALLLDHNYFAAACEESQKALQKLQTDTKEAMANISFIASASLTRGRALIRPMLQKLAHDGEEEEVVQRTAEEARAAFALALLLCPGHQEAEDELNALDKILSELSDTSVVDKRLESDTGSTQAFLEAEESHENPDLCKDVQEIFDTSDDNASGKTAEVNQDDGNFDVVIVGAGASGVGVGLTLMAHFGIDRKRILVLERGTRVGESFRQWPKEMRFISPSFNQAGWTSSLDLNSIAHGTSPATFLLEEHPTGEQYANYLEAVANDIQLPIQFCTDVTQICPLGVPGHPRFKIYVKHSQVGSAPAMLESVHCKYVIWAAGEFQYPKQSGSFDGMELCRHNSTVRSWADLPGDEFVVIGGYESGIDAAVQLARTRREVTVLASSPCWEENSRDPSGELAPYTRARLKDVMGNTSLPKPKLHGGLTVTRVAKADKSYLVFVNDRAKIENVEHAPAAFAESGEHHDHVGPRCFSTSSPPILCVGFQGSVAAVVGDLFRWEGKATLGTGEDDAAEHQISNNASSGSPCLTDQDESTRTEGLFLVGPTVSHEGLIFCFVYKFRQRFAVVAEAVARRLQKDTHLGVMTCRSGDMFLDDFAGIHACCGE